MKVKLDLSLDEFVVKLAGIGVPALIFMLVMASTGLAGAAAVTASLALLGPGGMIGGIVTLLVGAVGSEMIAKFGIETIISLVIAQLYKKGLTQEEIELKIRRYPISKGLKLKLIDKFRELNPADKTESDNELTK